MAQNTIRTGVRTALLASAAVVAVSPGAFAQGQGAVETVVVTGSRLPVQGLVSASPLQVTSSDQIKAQGTINVENILNSLPQISASQGGQVANGSSGTATVDLRGLGSERTLVLIDGKRLMPGDPNSNGTDTEAADINNIPAALIDHIEIVTGGASAVYGSDAVAGVVNFIMRKDFEGLELDGTISDAWHSNDDSSMRALVGGYAAGNPEQFKLAPSSIWDGRNIDVTALMGVNSSDGKGNITAYFGYRNTKAIWESDRDYSACSTAANYIEAVGGAIFGPPANANWACIGSSNSAVAYIKPQPPAVNSGPYRTNTDGTLTPYVSSRDAFNFAPYNYLQRPDERYQFGAQGHYQLNPMFDFYTSLMFMDDHTVAQSRRLACLPALAAISAIMMSIATTRF